MAIIRGLLETLTAEMGWLVTLAVAGVEQTRTCFLEGLNDCRDERRSGQWVMGGSLGSGLTERKSSGSDLGLETERMSPVPRSLRLCLRLREMWKAVSVEIPLRIGGH